MPVHIKAEGVVSAVAGKTKAIPEHNADIDYLNTTIDQTAVPGVKPQDGLSRIVAKQNKVFTSTRPIALSRMDSNTKIHCTPILPAEGFSGVLDLI